MRAVNAGRGVAGRGRVRRWELCVGTESNEEINTSSKICIKRVNGNQERATALARTKPVGAAFKDRQNRARSTTQENRRACPIEPCANREPA